MSQSREENNMLICIYLYTLYILYVFYNLSQPREERRLQSCRPIGDGTGELLMKMSQFWEFDFSPLMFFLLNCLWKCPTF